MTMGAQWMEYDRGRLRVWPDWGSSGIWYPQAGSEPGQGPVSMASHEALGLPDWLAERFARWIEWYDDYLPERPDAFPWEKFKDEGRMLAFELARFVGDEYQVEYDGRKVIVLP